MAILKTKCHSKNIYWFEYKIIFFLEVYPCDLLDKVDLSLYHGLNTQAELPESLGQGVSLHVLQGLHGVMGGFIDVPFTNAAHIEVKGVSLGCWEARSPWTRAPWGSPCTSPASYCSSERANLPAGRRVGTHQLPTPSLHDALLLVDLKRSEIGK